MAPSPRIRPGSPGTGSRPTRSAIAGAIALALTGFLVPVPAPGQAQGPSASVVYLPRLDRLAADAAPEACRLAAADWQCPDNGWRLSCGGLGAIRELISLQDPEGTVLAVGDGVARFRLTGGRPSWTAQLGGPLTGLSSAALGTRPEAQAWAAGHAGRLALQANGCWQPAPTRNPDLDLRAIRAVKLGATANFFGWAVGARCAAEGSACRGAVIHLDHPDDPLAWVDQGAADLPPLDDVVLRRTLAAPGDPRVETWMVGGQDLGSPLAAERSLGRTLGRTLSRTPGRTFGETPGRPATDGAPSAPAQPQDQGQDCRPAVDSPGLFLRASAAAPHTLNPVACVSGGRPEELTFTSAGGLALGPSRTSGDLLGWQVDAPSGTITALADPLASGRKLSDLYYANLDPSGLSDLPRLWMGLAPARGASVVLEIGLSPAGAPQVEPLGLPPALATDPPPPAAAGESALAPLLSDPDDGSDPLQLLGLLYAWGDGVWLRDQQSADWSQVRRRRDLVALTGKAGPQEPGPLLALSVEGGHGRLLRQSADGLREISAYNSLLDRLPTPRALLAAAGSYWLAGDEGLLLNLDGQGSARLLAPPPAGAGAAPPRLTALAAAADGGLWVLAEDSAAQQGLLWHRQPASGSWSLLAEGGALRGLAAGAAGEVWAVGPGRVLWSTPGCAAAAPAAPWSCACQDLAGAARRVCRLEPRWPLDLRAVAPAGAGAAWAVTGRNLLWLNPTDGSRWAWRYPLERTPLQTGQEIQSLLRDDRSGSVWVLSRCGRDGWFGSGADRGVGCGAQPPFWGAVSRFRPGPGDPVAGSWEAASDTVVNVLPHALAQAPDPTGRPAIWLAGDWTTLAYKTIDGRVP